MPIVPFIAERRLEVQVDLPLATHNLLDAEGLWGRLLKKIGVEIAVTLRTSECHGALLTSSALLLFEHRIVLLCGGSAPFIPLIDQLRHLLSGPQIKLLCYEERGILSPELIAYYDQVIEDLVDRFPDHSVVTTSQRHALSASFSPQENPSVAPPSVQSLLIGLADETFTLLRGAGSGAIDRIFETIPPPFSNALSTGAVATPRGVSLMMLHGDRYFVLTALLAEQLISIESTPLDEHNQTELRQWILSVFRPKRYVEWAAPGEMPTEVGTA